MPGLYGLRTVLYDRYGLLTAILRIFCVFNTLILRLLYAYCALILRWFYGLSYGFLPHWRCIRHLPVSTDHPPLEVGKRGCRVALVYVCMFFFTPFELSGAFLARRPYKLLQPAPALGFIS